MAASSEETTERDINTGHVGALLQASRQRLGEELAEVALMLRIRLPYLAAIEAGRYRELPGATYAVGFIRAYAEHLGLDSEEVVRRFKAETIDGGTDQKLSFPTPVPETGIPGGAYVFIGLVVAVLAYGAWYVSTTEDGFFAELVSPLDEQLSNLISNDDPPETPAGGTPQEIPTVSPASEMDKPDDSIAPAVEPQSAAETESDASSAISESDAVDAENAPATIDPPALSSPEGQSAEPQAEVDPAIAETNATAAVDKPATPPEVSVAPTANESLTSSDPSTADSPAAPALVTETPPAATVDRSAASTIVPEPEPEPEPEPSPSPSLSSTPEAIVAAPVQSPAAVENEPAAATLVEAAPIEAAPIEAPISIEPPITEPPVSADAAPAEPAEIAAVADIVSETEPAPIVTSIGTESEIAAPEPPAVPTPETTTTEPDTSEVADIVPPQNTSVETASRITINAKNNSWIQVRDDVANQMLVTRLLTSGDSYEVPNRPGLVLLTGNAGALEIVVDGTAVPSIGGIGVVRRGVALEPERLKGGTAVTN